MRMSIGAQADMQQCFPACGDVEMLPFLLVVVGGGGGGGGGEGRGGRGGMDEIVDRWMDRGGRGIETLVVALAG